MPSPLKLTFVVATRDRPDELIRMWRSLRSQSRVPDEVVIVDASARPSTLVGPQAGPPALCYIRTAVASATRQRNIGLDAVRPEAGLVGFLDDDAVLEEGAVEEMLRFWGSAGAEVGGAAFNMTNHPPLRAARWKSLPFVEHAGIYGRKPGAVLKSGFQTMIGTVAETTPTAWLPSGAVVWRREVLRRLKFDEWFSDYGYLEDLDFSYGVGKSLVLKVVAGARYAHHPQASSRLDPFRFGRKEVANRLYFVRKNPELSPGLCRLALCLRMLMSLADGILRGKGQELRRARGNLVSLLNCGR